MTLHQCIKRIIAAIAKLKRNIPLTDADLVYLEKLLFNTEAVESRERFKEVYRKNLSLKLFIRQLLGLDLDFSFVRNPGVWEDGEEIFPPTLPTPSTNVFF
ncbi:MAG: hypothetical protein RM338_03935 [Nostoc sp. DedQUE12a]|nr:hypothetical protein [Nostoc sp. DedQUE12a]